jgi:hypothetical protein
MTILGKKTPRDFAGRLFSADLALIFICHFPLESEVCFDVRRLFFSGWWLCKVHRRISLTKPIIIVSNF